MDEYAYIDTNKENLSLGMYGCWDAAELFFSSSNDSLRFMSCISSSSISNTLFSLYGAKRTLGIMQ